MPSELRTARAGPIVPRPSVRYSTWTSAPAKPVFSSAVIFAPEPKSSTSRIHGAKRQQPRVVGDDNAILYVAGEHDGAQRVVNLKRKQSVPIDDAREVRVEKQGRAVELDRFFLEEVNPPATRPQTLRLPDCESRPPGVSPRPQSRCG